MSELNDYFKGDALAIKVWLDKYWVKDKNGAPLEKTPDDMHRRLAEEFHRVGVKTELAELEERKRSFSKLSYYGATRNYLSESNIFDLFKDFKYIIPQGSVMAQAGTGTLGLYLIV